MKFIPNFEEYLSDKMSSLLDESEWADLVQQASWHRTAVRDKDRLFEVLNDNENLPLLTAIIRSVFIPNDEDCQTILMHSFSNYIQSQYPKIPFLKNIAKWRGLGPNKNIKSIVSWYYHVTFDNETLICDECSDLMVPSFVKSGRFCCPNEECSQFAIPIYENYCWKCFDDVSSVNCNECGNCGWVICSNCSSCKDPKFGGSCDEQVPVETKIKRPISPYLLKQAEDESKKYFSSQLLDDIYSDSIDAYRYIPSNNMHSNNCNRGKKIIDQDQELDNYIAFYLPMHVAKLFELFDNIEVLKDLNDTVNIYDWGCGQGIATMSLLEYAKINHLSLNIEKIVLIEPSTLAIQKGKRYVERTDVFKDQNCQLSLINKDLNSLSGNDLFEEENYEIHLFSNILDVDGIDIEHVRKLVNHHSSKKTIIIASPNFFGARKKIDQFVDYFDSSKNIIYEHQNDLKVFCKDFRSKKNRNRRCTSYSKVFELN